MPAAGAGIRRPCDPCAIRAGLGGGGREGCAHAAGAAAGRCSAACRRRPVGGRAPLLVGGDRSAAGLYFEILHTLFVPEASYEEGRRYAVLLPAAARNLLPQRRGWQLRELLRVVRSDRRLAAPYLDGIFRGLGRLRAEALNAFVEKALEGSRGRPEQAARELALESREARERANALQVGVGLDQVRGRLHRYLSARIGRRLAIRPLSALSAAVAESLGPERLVCSDAHAIYLPHEIDRFPGRAENEELYRLLVCAEACFHEFGSFDFRLETGFGAGNESMKERLPPGEEPSPARSDLAIFLGRFPDPPLAADLFTACELGRVRKRLEHLYPGLARRLYPRLRREFIAAAGASPPDARARLMARLALALPAAVADPEIDPLAAAFDAAVSAASPVAASAQMTARFFQALRVLTPDAPLPRTPLAPPFGWRPWPNPAAALDPKGPVDHLAARIRAALAAHGVAAGRDEIRRMLAAGDGSLSAGEVRTLCGGREAAAAAVTALLAPLPGASPRPEREGCEEGPVFFHPEWDDALGDYLPDHVRLRERVPPGGDAGFYAAVLARHAGLVRRARRVFEALRPEGVKRLRRWPEGDEFDYRQMIEAAVDRRAGRLPSERLFIKRLKQRREVAVLVLVDVSRSTTGLVPGSAASVLEIEKEAIVVLCEALAVLGDALAVAAFSGSGRTGVDYLRVKAFEEGLTEGVKQRIGALSPQRNTRMGAAIRHAARELSLQPARVRLLILVSDGFPNDTEYRGAQAVADTRQALTELGARQIRFHALTVNLPADPQLDRLYGKAHHQVISDVRELPGRMVRVYRALTR
ncbi:MAG: hypothetical protein MUF46_10375 [Desulfobacterales bacterium]|nr:hypothetical protein [Desulfobacterales bacterium]